MSYFTRYLQRLVKFRQHRKKWKVDSASKPQKQSGFTVSWKYCLNLCSLRRRKGAGCAKFYKNLFETPVLDKCLKWVFQVCFCVSFKCGKRLFRSKKDYQVQMWIIASSTGRFFEWVSVFLEKRKKERLPWVWFWPLSDSTMAFFVYICQKDDNQFRDTTYTQSITEPNIF